MLSAGVLAFAQPASVMNDLERRALAAMEAIQRSESGAQQRSAIRARLEQSLHLNRLPAQPAGAGFLYLPNPGVVPAPAVVVLRPHRDPTQRESQLVPAALAQRGMLVLEVDVRASHSRLDLLHEGAVPQSFIQRDVRAAIAYLKARTDVDANRLALVGEGLAATVGVAANTAFSAAVLWNGAPDLRFVVRQWRALPSGQFPDSCALLPGILKFAASEELLSLIAPRPLLLFHAEPAPSEYATDVYRAGASLDRLRQAADEEWTMASRSATSSWLAEWLRSSTATNASQEPVGWPQPLPVTLGPYAAPASLPRSAMTPALLASLLGEPLPEGPMTFGLNCRGDQHIDFSTQPGLSIRATALRPGPQGCDASRGSLIAVDDRGRGALAGHAIVSEALRRGWVVWTVDPRGIGELATHQDGFAFGASLLLGENFTWRQSTDIARVLHAVAGASSRYPTGLYARGKVMSLAGMYVAAITGRNDLEWVVLEDAPTGFSQESGLPLSAIPVGGMPLLDIPELTAAARPKLLVIDNPGQFLQRGWW